MPRIVIAIHVHPDCPPDWQQELVKRYTMAVTECDVAPYGTYHVDHIQSGLIEGEEMQHARLSGRAYSFGQRPYIVNPAS